MVETLFLATLLSWGLLMILSLNKLVSTIAKEKDYPSFLRKTVHAFDPSGNLIRWLFAVALGLTFVVIIISWMQ